MESQQKGMAINMKQEYAREQMTEREYRAYRQYRRRVRRQREILKRCILTAMTVLLILTGTLSYRAIKSSANSGDSEVSFKYYKSITVAYGDTVWGIADDYVDYDHYKNTDAYVKEVKSINHLDENATIKAGQHLVIPYYSTEFKK